MDVPRQLLPYPLQLLQTSRRAHRGRHLLIRKAGLPVGDADLADIDVAPGIQRDAVRRQEFSARNARARLAAEPRDAVAFRVHDREPRAEIGHLAVDGQARTEFPDDEGRAFAATAAA